MDLEAMEEAESSVLSLVLQRPLDYRRLRYGRKAITRQHSNTSKFSIISELMLNISTSCQP